MSKQEVEDAMFRFERPNKPGLKVGPAQYVSEELPPEQAGDALCFNIRGEWTADEVACAAKRVTTSRGIRYFIKWCMEGHDKGHPLNPYSVYYREGDDVKLEQRRGKLKYEFKLVNETAFNYYLSFLKTKLVSHCQSAEREVLNA